MYYIGSIICVFVLFAMYWRAQVRAAKLGCAVMNAIVHEAELDAEITRLIESKERVRITDAKIHGCYIEAAAERDELISKVANLALDRDKWQVEAAKRQATIERQGSDILSLQLSLKTARLGNNVRATNR